jgi:hypothetical protein
MFLSKKRKLLTILTRTRKFLLQKPADIRIKFLFSINQSKNNANNVEKRAA